MKQTGPQLKRATKVTCPRCGRRTVDVRYYRNEDRAYIHAKKQGLFGFTEITDSCYINAKTGG